MVSDTRQDSSALELQQALRTAGLRATPARMAVLAVLRAAQAPLSHAEVIERMADSLWDRATLYRNLVDLARAGLLHRVDLGDHVWRFEARGEVHTSPSHPHFVCTDCGTVACVPGVQVVVSPGSDAAWLGPEVEVQLKGLCGDCR